LPRRPGQKEQRYAQLLGGEPESAAMRDDAPASSDDAKSDRLTTIERDLEELREQYVQLRSELDLLRDRIEG
jgi:hypothetical protein